VERIDLETRTIVGQIEIQNAQLCFEYQRYEFGLVKSFFLTAKDRLYYSEKDPKKSH
jgi:hypothetical protein